MKILLQNLWVRLLASAAVASVVVVGIVGGGIRYYEPEERDDAVSALQYVDIVNVGEKAKLAEAIRKERERYGDIQPKHEPPPPPPPRPARQVSGFVQVEYLINPDGSVSDVKVIGAAPSGIYEKQAVEQVSRSMHAPVFNDAGEAVARRTTEIVEFTVSSDQLQGSASP